MKVVVDLGCIPRNGANSLAALAWEYDPDIIYGFDPGDQLVEGTVSRRHLKIVLRRAAAWTEDGTVKFHEDGSGSRVSSEYGVDIPSFDFSHWLRNLKRRTKADVFVKMDIEGAEYPVLERMVDEGTDRMMSELLVEWHNQPNGLDERLRCPVREWWL